MVRAALISLVLMAVAAAPFASSAQDISYSIVDHFPGPDDGYDYISVDSATERVFVARTTGVMTIDLATRKVKPGFVAGQDVSAVAIIPGTDLMLSTNFEGNSATLFNRHTGEVKKNIPTGSGPDAALYDEKSGLAFVMNATSKDVTVIDIAAATAEATVALGGKPEAAAIDGKGRLYINIEDTAEIAVVNVDSRSVVARYKLPDCVEPTGLAYDTESNLLVSACANGKAKLIDAAKGSDRGSVEIGTGADGAIFDATRRLVYIPCFDGTLSIFSLERDGRAGVVTTVKTTAGARTAALDPTNGRIYLPAAAYQKDAEGKRTRVPGTFQVLVVGPSARTE
ncbi:MAG: gluconolactonase [Xanthomonadales bacterium]|nr:gluconolactonase [Xanthomonadales bacterium]